MINFLLGIIAGAVGILILSGLFFWWNERGQQ